MNPMLQLMHRASSSSWSRRAALRPAESGAIRGRNVIAFSGQPTSHSPHCTQFASTNRSFGSGAVSATSADVGHRFTQAWQSVHAARSTSTSRNGAPAGSGTGVALPPWARMSSPAKSASVFQRED